MRWVKRSSLKWLLVSLLFSHALMAERELYDSYEIGEGGRLYDNWAAELGVSAPSRTHPGYNDYKGKQRGAVTWRCKECHGWDYRGAAGNYGVGEHYTGTQGIFAARRTSIPEVLATLKNDNHLFDQFLPARQLEAVAAFVVLGQVDMRRFIHPITKKISGDARKGRLTYLEQCSLCHGSDGKTRNLSRVKGKKRYLGGVAQHNPWKTMHKIRFGHPGKFYTNKYDPEGRPRLNMPAMLGVVTLQDQIDLLAYLSTLPVK